MGDRIRAFIAIPLPRKVIDLARNVQERLRCQGLRMRWTRPDSIHLTLKFLGDIDTGRLAVLEKALEQTARNTGPMHLAAGGLGVFPNVKKARVLWMGIAGETAVLLDAQKRLAEQLAALGHTPEKRRFSAHLTLARARGIPDPRQLVSCMETVGGFDAVPFTARQIVLYRSELKPGGAVYTVLVKKNLV